jgi:SAM-dependent methyltransferase
MRFARALDEAKQPVLDAGCGYGRNAVALALRGIDVVCVDRDQTRLEEFVSLAIPFMAATHPSGKAGKLYPLCTDLSERNWPFSLNCFSAIVCIHFPDIWPFEAFRSSLVLGGYLYLETFGGHDQNYLALPKAGSVRVLLGDSFRLIHYREHKVGSSNLNAVTVKLFAQRS